LVKTQSKNPAREKTLRKRIGIGVAIFGMVCLITVWQRVYVEETIRDIGKLEKQLQELEERNNELEIMLTQLRDFRRLHEIAQTQVDLSFPERITLTIPSEYTKLVKEDDPEFYFLEPY
jgi:cell division protein FtsB